MSGNTDIVLKEQPTQILSAHGVPVEKHAGVIRNIFRFGSALIVGHWGMRALNGKITIDGVPESLIALDPAIIYTLELASGAFIIHEIVANAGKVVRASATAVDNLKLYLPRR